jgi:hypothetical protein
VEKEQRFLRDLTKLQTRVARGRLPAPAKMGLVTREELFHGFPPALPFTGPGVLDFDDVGAEVAEEVRGPRSHRHAREI